MSIAFLRPLAGRWSGPAGVGDVGDCCGPLAIECWTRNTPTTRSSCVRMANQYGPAMSILWNDHLVLTRGPRSVCDRRDCATRGHAAEHFGGHDSSGRRVGCGDWRAHAAICIGAASPCGDVDVHRHSGLGLGHKIVAGRSGVGMKYLIGLLVCIPLAANIGCSAILPAASAALGASQALVVGAAGASTNFEYQKLIEVHSRYDGLEHQSVAILVDATLELQYEHPDVIDMIAGGVAARIGEHVEGVKILHPLQVRDWQYRTAQWSAMPWGEVAAQLQVDRILLIDIQDFRLHPRGNRWLWEGVCRAVVAVAERDGYDADEFVDVWEVEARFPELEGLDRDSAGEEEIKTGLMAEFTKQTGWIFYMHLEPKHPDKYNSSLDPELGL